MIKIIQIIALLLISAFTNLNSFDVNNFIQDKISAIPNIPDLIDRSFQEAKEQLKSKLVNETRTAAAVSSSALTQPEIDARNNRKATGKFKNAVMTLGANENLNMAFSGSGGGYRAMIYALGALEGAQKAKLLDASLYMSALSGSTWALNGWLASGLNLDQLNNQITKNVKANKLLAGGKLRSPIPEDLDDFKQKDEMIKNFAKKYLFNQDLTSIDIWGAVIANNILEKQNALITQQRSAVGSGKFFYPLNTAVNPRNDGSYHWYEVTPNEVRNLNTETYVPTWSFGRVFNNGKSVDFAPEQALAFYMGTFGSAFTVSPEELIRLNNLQEQVAQSVVDFLFSNDGIYNKVYNYVVRQIPTRVQIVPAIPSKLITPEQIIPATYSPEVPATWLSPRIPPKQITPEKVIPAVYSPEVPAKYVDIPADKIKEFADKTINAKINDYKATIKEQIKSKFTWSWNELVPGPFKKYRLFPAKLPSFISGENNVVLVDAGIAANIPLAPLFKPERKIDVIIVLDGSETVKGAPELKKALDELKITYPNLDYSKLGVNSVSVISDKNDMKKPVIIYVPMAKDALLGNNTALQKALKTNKLLRGAFTNEEIKELQKFDPAICATQGFCSTFNFKYAPDEFRVLSNLGKFNVLANIDKIKSAITKRKKS